MDGTPMDVTPQQYKLGTKACTACRKGGLRAGSFKGATDSLLKGKNRCQPGEGENVCLLFMFANLFFAGPLPRTARLRFRSSRASALSP